MIELKTKKVYKKRKNTIHKMILLNKDLVVSMLSKVESCHCLDHYRCSNCNQRKDNLEILNNYSKVPKWLKEMFNFCLKENIPLRIEMNGLVIGKHSDYYIGYSLVHPKKTFRIAKSKRKFDSLFESKTMKSIKNELINMRQGGIL